MASRQSGPVLKDHPELLQRTGWDGPRAARSSRHRPSGGVSARTNPTSPPGTSAADGVGWTSRCSVVSPPPFGRRLGSNESHVTTQNFYSGRGGIRTHEARSLPTRSPGVRLKPLGHPSKRGSSHLGQDPNGAGMQRREWDGPRPARPSRCRVPPGASARPNPTSPSKSPSAEGVGFEPTRVFRPNALAGRRLKPLGHPSKTNGPGPALRTRASSCPAWARTRTLLIQSQTCCQLHHGASNQTITNPGSPCTPPQEGSWPAEREPPVGIEPTTPSLRVTCSTI